MEKRAWLRIAATSALFGVFLVAGCLTTEVRLGAGAAKLNGNLKYSASGQVLCMWNGSDQYPTWTATIPEAGDYEVAINYACPTEYSGTPIAVSIGNQTLTARVNGTGSFGNFITETVGHVKLPAGKYEVKVQPTSNPQKWVMDLNEVLLTKTYK